MKSQTLEAPANGATFPNQHHHRHTTITSTNNPLDTQPSIGNQFGKAPRAVRAIPVICWLTRGRSALRRKASSTSATR